MNPIDTRPSLCPAQSHRDVRANFRRHMLRRFGVSGYFNSTVLLLYIDTASIRRLIHSGYMAKQREATGLEFNRGKWRLLSGMTDIFIPHEIRPFEAKDSSQAPLVQRVNSK